MLFFSWQVWAHKKNFVCLFPFSLLFILRFLGRFAFIIMLFVCVLMRCVVVIRVFLFCCVTRNVFAKSASCGPSVRRPSSAKWTYTKPTSTAGFLMKRCVCACALLFLVTEELVLYIALDEGRYLRQLFSPQGMFVTFLWALRSKVL